MIASFKPISARSRRITAALALGLMAAACATVPPASDPAALAEFEARNDPLEPTNRVIHDFNQGIDAVLIKPLAEVYHFILPNFVERRITAILRNAREPWTFVNDLLQGETDRAGTTAKRFLTNTTVGLGGMFDVAKDQGLERHTEDFGQTLAVWGVDDGPYLVLPFLGSSNPRDAVGTAVGFFADPVSIAQDQANVKGLTIAVIGTQALDARARNLDLIERLKAESIDYYSTLRSAYRQERESDIRNGAPPEDAPEDDIFEEFEDFEGMDDSPGDNGDEAALLQLEF
ncbi:MAG: VacJ family lipoprotein [Alphaproteobacteria bacterium]